LEIGCKVTLALPEHARETQEYDVHLKAIEPRFRFSPGPRIQPPTLKYGWQQGADFIETVGREKPDRVFVPFSDYFTQSATLRRLITFRRRLVDPPVEAHLNRGTYAYPYESARDWLRGVASRELILRCPWQIVHLLDPWMYDPLKNRSSRAEFRIIPEPVEPLPELSRDDARRALGVPTDGRYAAMIGLLRPGKGLEGLLESFARAKLAADDRMLLVGKMTEPVRRHIHERYDQLVREGRIVYIDRYVTDHELDCGFVAADIVTVTHNRLIGSSGTLLRAAHAGRMLVTTDYGWAGWATRTFELGVTANVGNVEVLADALEKAFPASSSYHRSKRGDRFCQFHTLNNWKAHWLAGIGRDCGISLGRHSQRTDWNWALEAVQA
jgi:glycosyltransferase involved in cell wall biosynthesis